MPNPEQPRFHIDGGSLTLAAIAGAAAGTVGALAWEAPASDRLSQVNADIDQAVLTKDSTEELYEDIQLLKLEATPAGELVAKSLAEQTAEVQALVAERPVIEQGQDMLVGIGLGTLFFVTRNIYKQRKQHQAHLSKAKAAATA